ncbi:MAG: CCA tRNA nucleotidyltransferase [Acetobacter sp.]|nr:CCA tRNA nucleotidyltransferase [Acetobacter sp.]
MLFEQLEPISQKAVKCLWTILPQSRLVGGCVRDILAHQYPITDIDMATPQPPEEVMHLLRAAGIHVIPTGIRHGTVTAVIEGIPYEITTLRRDEETDGRHACVCWTSDWKEDALRRDFTINALSMDCNGVVYDYVGGRADLASGIVRFVGDATIRIREDALRILRYFRFYARFSCHRQSYQKNQYDKSALQTIRDLSSLVCGLSVERVWSELKRILYGPSIVETLRLMEQTGVLAYIFPEGFSIDRLESLFAFGRPSLDISHQVLLRLVAIVDQPKQAAKRLKFSREESRFVCAVSQEFSQEEKQALTHHESFVQQNTLRALLFTESKDILEGRLWLAQCAQYRIARDCNSKKNIDIHHNSSSFEQQDFGRAIECLATIQKPEFPVAGRDVIAMGQQSGFYVGVVLERVRKWWFAGGCCADRAACLRKLAEVIQQEQDKFSKPPKNFY